MALILKNFSYFLIFWETETPKKISYISGNRNPKKLLVFQKMELLSPNSKTKQKYVPRKFLIFQEMELSSSNGNFFYFLKRKLFLYFGK